MADQQHAAPKGRDFDAIKQSFSQSFLNMQQPGEFIINMLYAINMYAPIRVCIEVGIFRRLAASSQTMTISQLAKDIEGLPNPSTEEEQNEREEFLARSIRAACAINLVDEAGPYVYLSNELTRTFADPGFEAGFNMFFHNSLGPHSTTHSFYEYAKKNGYRAPDSSLDGPFQHARGIPGRTSFQVWTQDEPASMSGLSALMWRVQQDRLNWSAWFPAESLFGKDEQTDDGVFMVDVGGGLGHDLSGFAERYSSKAMKLVLQDQPEVIAEAKGQKLDGRITLMEQNFFQPQAVKGAKIYFMHKIMHDWPDRECVQVLAHLREAMTTESRIFINDIILPDESGSFDATAFDIGMLTWLSAKERSELMWRNLIAQVKNLSVEKFWQAPGMKGEGIVEVVKTEYFK